MSAAVACHPGTEHRGSQCALQWNTYTPEASFETVCNGEQYAAMVLQQGGPEALQQWKQLEQELRPLQQGASSFPAAALRSDVGTCWLAGTSLLLEHLSDVPGQALPN